MITRSGFLKCLLALPFVGCAFPQGRAKVDVKTAQIFDISWVKDPIDPTTKIQCEEFAPGFTSRFPEVCVVRACDGVVEAWKTGGPTREQVFEAVAEFKRMEHSREGRRLHLYATFKPGLDPVYLHSYEPRPVPLYKV